MSCPDRDGPVGTQYTRVPQLGTGKQNLVLVLSLSTTELNDKSYCICRSIRHCTAVLKSGVKIIYLVTVRVDPFMMGTTKRTVKGFISTWIDTAAYQIDNGFDSQEHTRIAVYYMPTLLVNDGHIVLDRVEC